MGRSLILLSAICLVLASGANASVKKGDFEIEVQGGWMMENSAGQGTDQDTILAGETGADLDGWFASGGIGYFTSRNFEIGLAGFGAWLDGSEKPRNLDAVALPGSESFTIFDVDVDASVYGGGGRFKWHFSPKKALVPYVGIQVCWATADIDISGTAEEYVTADEVTELVNVNDVSESDSKDGILWGPIVGLRYQLARQIEVLVEYQYHMWSGDIGDLIDDGHAISAGLCLKLK